MAGFQVIIYGRFWVFTEGEAKESLTRQFLTSLAQTSTLDHVDECFPFNVLAVHAPAQRFYDFYGI